MQLSYCFWYETFSCYIDQRPPRAALRAIADIVKFSYALHVINCYDRSLNCRRIGSADVQNDKVDGGRAQIGSTDKFIQYDVINFRKLYDDCLQCSCKSRLDHFCPTTIEIFNKNSFLM